MATFDVLEAKEEQKSKKLNKSKHEVEEAEEASLKLSKSLWDVTVKKAKNTDNLAPLTSTRFFIRKWFIRK